MIRVYLKVELLLCVLLLSACAVSGGSRQIEGGASDEGGNKKISSVFFENPIIRFHYVERRGNSKNLIVFIHGTPGDWSIFSPQLNNDELSGVASMVAIDRPGWGQSTLSSGDYVFSLADQSQKIWHLLSELRQAYNPDKLVLVGHSLGASLVPRIAMDFPELVDGVIAISGDLSEQYSAAHWYNSAASSFMLKWMLPKQIRKANDEVLALDRDLKIMSPLWGGMQVPMLVIQGTKDGLVDPRHADFAEGLITKAGIEVARIEGAGHLVHIKNEKEVTRLIIDYVQRLSTTNPNTYASE